MTNSSTDWDKLCITKCMVQIFSDDAGKNCDKCIQMHYIGKSYVTTVWRWENIWWFWKKNVTSVYNALYRESSSQSVSHWKYVSAFKIHCLQMLQLFQTKKGSIFSIVTFVYSGYIAFPYILLHQKIFVPYIILCTARLSLFHTVSLFSPLKYIVYRCYSCFRQRRGHFFHRHTCIQWLHSFSLYNALCIHLSRFFGASSENICPIHYIVNSSSQSVSHWKYVSASKLHCLQMLFQTKKGSLFSLSHLYTVVA